MAIPPCGRRGFSGTGQPICTLDSGHKEDCVLLPKPPPLTREQQLEKENTELKLRIVHLENGAGVIEAADAYATRQKAYAEQVERLAAALLEAREELRRLGRPAGQDDFGGELRK